MMIHEITELVGAHKRRKRVGRGRSSGHGKTSGRGQKGATSRSGYTFRAGYEGGQKPFAQRIAKRGFSNVRFATEYHVVNLQALEARCEAGTQVDVELLARLGLVRDAKLPLKVLGHGDLTKKLDVVAARFSASARSKIEKAGGSVTENPVTTWVRDRSAPKAAKPSKSA
ncbi:MAG TPA: 50S ribosomal protein L15 [Phycisphaerales bacterium]|nr:50S ribosomal protein L15 [Phycisphaerales bacterium]HMP36423.1 50S ribosomal protein L15 [Phycisphaerales bacterium]